MRKFFYLFIAALVLVACDENEPEPEVQYPAGAIHGVFSIGAKKYVMFSQGNLQYNSAMLAYRFAEHQWDTIGASNLSGGALATTIDLFAWGTGNTPTSKETHLPFVDWGVNAIMNGGNQTYLWRTLSKDEWNYLIFERKNAAKLVSMGTVNGVPGTILLPDYWPSDKRFEDNAQRGLVIKSTAENKYYQNPNINSFFFHKYTISEWSTMEAGGAVFLPAAGWSNSRDVLYVASKGYYWSTTPSLYGNIYLLYFSTGYLEVMSDGAFKCAVRLVQDVK